ncbi:5-histidylcysteine sulfoxide synthase [uncultured Lamprocystis sp.]|jgi:5-histidylcysteine sulfoxide synthase/putative 4-mercaptohistidine N1-methyltranferase|uniref:5-histidylcysteine sulfoxide synthase n=2 Tax=uncultured Lamprocystis sp. TaxID=543132 RepID=UPI0025DE7BE0|nr:5-histidylcysteine sulfoxide synthase [uncultured Lamprocystis sp.]
MIMERFPRTPLLHGDDPETKRREIRDYFIATFDRYESLFATLATADAYYRKPIALRHPLIFYFGHTATFFINKLILAGLLEQRIEPKFESMFAVGVDEMSWDDLDESNYDWPSVQAVRDYRKRVRGTVIGLIERLPLRLPINWDSPWWPILMGIEHERIHLETSTVLIRQQSLDCLRTDPAWEPCRETGEPPANPLVPVAAGSIRLDKHQATASHYGWDNEYGLHEAEVPAFEASRTLVSNREFLAFVETGGYETDSWWTPEGLAWRQFSQARYPTFWVPEPAGWRLRLMLETVPMPWNWPVEVNYHEAKAFCLWKAEQTGTLVRLPTEDEWYRLYDTAGGTEVPADRPGAANLHLDHWASSCPVDRFPQGEFFDVTGNVWQWTETPIYPFAGFRVHPLYDDFTTPTFDERHNLMKGGSWISSGNESLRSARYAFRRHFFQHAGFRTVVGAAPERPVASHYETDRLLSEYAEFHYGDQYHGVPNFPRALAVIALRCLGDRPARRALDLGCATGRATFELARRFAEVTGMDFSARFIGLGAQLADQGVLRYTLVDEGELVSWREVWLKDLGLAEVRDRVTFVQGDACNLKAQFTGYDLLLAANLIDRLYSPTRFLAQCHARINPGGLLLIASPYTWLTEHTPREEWLGGFKRDGENVTTLDGLKAVLGAHFRLIEGPLEVPFVIRETRRKFQHSLSEVTVWERLPEREDAPAHGHD